MTDEQRIEESSDQLGADDNEDVEAHKRRAAQTDEPAAKNDDDDDVEAHRRRA